MEYLIKELPNFLITIVTGYVFLKAYSFTALKKNPNDIQHILISSFVVGFIYCRLAAMIPFTISEQVDHVLIVLSALCAGYAIARLLRNKRVITPILDRLKIQDTGNAYFWDDLLDNEHEMEIYVDYGDVIYGGVAHNFESYSNSPHVVLASYIAKDKNGKVLADHSGDCTRVIILDTASARSVEIEYERESAECEDIQMLCEERSMFSEEEAEQNQG